MYVLFSCDEWKSYNSMRVVGIYSCLEKLVQRIEKEVSEDNMELDDNYQNNTRDINNALTYGYVEYFDVDDMD